jgi:hypothetical protein
MNRLAEPVSSGRSACQRCPSESMCHRIGLTRRPAKHRHDVCERSPRGEVESPHLRNSAPGGLAPGWSASVLQETGKVFAGLGLKRRIDAVRWVLTRPPGQRRVFDTSRWPSTTSSDWSMPYLIFWSGLDFMAAHPLLGVLYTTTGFGFNHTLDHPLAYRP